MYADMEAKVSGLNKKITGLEADLAACKKARAALDGEVSLANGRVREMQAELDAAKAAAKAPKATGTASFASGLADTSTAAAATPPEPTPAPTPAPAKDIYAVIKEDDLQIIEGVGPKMESLLKENGITTHSMLASKSTADVQAILSKYGDKYKIIDPGTWVQQSKLAAGKQWEDLIDLQKKLDAGKDSNIDLTDSKLEKKLIKLGAIVRHKQDDLKAVEGIGPAIERLMHEAGIKTWRDMANTSVERLQSILEAAGSRFKLADPGTWPKQAEMAADGKFKELQEYQDFLQGGR